MSKLYSLSADSNTYKPSDDRRTFLKKTALATIALAGFDFSTLAGDDPGQAFQPESDIPWYRKASRWGQTNITEIDPAYDLTSTGTWRQPTDEFIPVGPVKVSVKLPEEVSGRKLKLLVSEQKISPQQKNGWVNFTIPGITDHEVIVIT
jgi:hypothetical protein